MPYIVSVYAPNLHYIPDCNCVNQDGDGVHDDNDEDIVDVERSVRRSKRLLKKQKRQKVTRSVKRAKKKRQPKNKRSRSHRAQSGMIEDEADEMLRVTVYWFKKPLKRNSKGNQGTSRTFVNLM
jgi:glycyl-tRNA synthetase beta subunit